MGSSCARRGRQARREAMIPSRIFAPFGRMGKISLSFRALALFALLVVLPAEAAEPKVAQGAGPAHPPYASRADVRAFAAEIADAAGLPRQQVLRWLAAAKFQPRIVAAMDRPLLQPPKWFEYAPPLLAPERVSGGVAFWRANAHTLARAEAEYGVPAEIIVAILGVETIYGQNTGSYRVIDALATLAFDYPRRAPFFRGELREYVMLVHERGWSPQAPKGSFAGAMGLPQFMPGSYRQYAVDFDGDGRIDLWRNSADVIGSVANYLARHDWLAGQPVLLGARIAPEARDAVLRRRTAASANAARCPRGRPMASTPKMRPPISPPIPSASCCWRSLPERRTARELLDRVPQFLCDHTLQQEPPLRGRRVFAGAGGQACARRDSLTAMADDPLPAPETAPMSAGMKDLPLREDTRLLGRLLGDVCARRPAPTAMRGSRPNRQTAIRFRRPRRRSAAVRAELSALLQRPADRADARRRARVQLFLATRQHRRGRPPEPAPPRARARGIAAAARQHRRCARLRRRAGRRPADALLAWFADALVGPVLTAHPTEVQRKSILDCEREIARLLQWRDRVALDARRDRRVRGRTLPAGAGAVADGDDAPVEAAGRATKSKTASRTTGYTFLSEVPAVLLALAARLHAQFGAAADFVLPPLLRPGSWIGGDRDGNPFVNGATLATRSTRRPRSPSRTISKRSTGSAANCPLSTRLVTPTAELLALARRPRDDESRIAQDEPYRQALIGIYARLAATAGALAGLTFRRARRMPTCRRMRHRRTARRTAHDRRARSHTHGAACSPPGGSRRCCARSRSSASILRCSTCGRTPTCTRRSIAELLARAGVTPRLRRAAGGGADRAARRRAARRPRLLHSPHLAYRIARAPSSRCSTAPPTSIAASGRRRCRTT